MSARDRILGRLRAVPAAAPLAAPDVTSFYASRKTLDASTRLENFRTAIVAAHAEVFDTTHTEWPGMLARLCAEKGIRSLAYEPSAPHSRPLAAEPGLPNLVPFPEQVESFKQRLFDEVDAGLTKADGAIAETGTLVAWTGPMEPRTLSLVPPVHFILLEENRIVDHFHQAMTDWAWAGRLPTNTLLISGPSKTADIQQTLAYGAHGPKELIVLLLRGEVEQ